MREGRSGESTGTRSGWDFSDSLDLIRGAFEEEWWCAHLL